jgi:hypothetical protein
MLKTTRDALLIWFGGVITELLSEITVQSLQAVGGESGLFPLRSDLKRLAEELSLGVRSPHSYCEQVITTTNSQIDPNTLEELILSKASLNYPVINLIYSIPDKIETWLISDYPESWFKIISSKDERLSKFSRERVIFTSQGGLEQMVPMVFNFASQASGHSIQECIIIDSISSRAVAAVRYGLSAIIYVYPEKLEHEFALRGILEIEQEVLHPKTSRRVDI